MSQGLTLHIENLRALRKVTFSPRETSLLVGPNGAGKTTLLLALRCLSYGYERNMVDAVDTILGGGHQLKNRAATGAEEISFGIDIDDLSWRLRINPSGSSIDPLAAESLHQSGREIFRRDRSGVLSVGKENLNSDGRLGIQTIINFHKIRPIPMLDGDIQWIQRIASFIQNLAVYHDPDLAALRQHGSSLSDNKALATRGQNAFAMLRKWHGQKARRDRYSFVVEGLKATFPRICEDLDFEEAGQSVNLRIFPRGEDKRPTPIAHEANGLLQMLILLCDVASGEDGSMVAIDEPENALHPFAIREFFRRSSRWARTHNLTLLLTTHSPVLIDELTGTPSRLFVLQEGLLHRLDQLKELDWLAKFRLGDLYVDEEYGGPEAAE